MLLVVSVLFGASCGGGDGQCDPAPKSDPLEVGESQTIGVEFVDGGWGLVDASGVYWSADFAAPEGAPANGVLSATVQLIDAQIEDDGDIERATLSVDLGEFGTVVLAGPVSCN